eukprot:Nitzschia sp. Nitz4//scaffold19_size178191//8780//11686//NITZ4_001953-RA/size178191-processed-gene-0.2-mRNA-1//1//CDS//3329540607//5554//frame0
MLILSVVSDLCHIVLLLHVRSTAPANADLFSSRPKVMFYYAKEQEETERDMLLPDQKMQPEMQRRISSGSTDSVRQISNRVVAEVKSRLKQTKDEWTKRLADYKLLSARAGSQEAIVKPVKAFRVVLQLFAYEDVLSNGRLNAAFEQDDGATLLNFVPQLLSFLLHGAYESSTDLEEWVLEMCRRNIFFAHRCYWFLRAWALESQKTSEGVPARLGRASSLLSFEEVIEDSISPTDERSMNQSGNLLPEERLLIEGLLHRVMKCGEEPARRLYFGNGTESESMDSTNLFNSSPSALMTAAESGIIPLDPSTGMPSAKHWECIAAPRKYGFLPLDRALTTNKEREGELYDTSYFDATPVFLDALLSIADGLFRVPREHRTKEFHQQLQLLEVEALPNNAIYVPLRDVCHRVWRIVAEESIAIGTKERVPCIVCLEVIEYPQEEAPQSRNVKRLLERVAPPENAISFPELTATISERDMIREWQYGYRDPHRRDTAFEKLASQMRLGMKKIPLDQMKTSMQAQLEKLVSAPSNEDDDDDDDDGDKSLTVKLNEAPSASSDIERGDPRSEDDTRSTNHLPAPASPESPKPTLKNRKYQMGQWTPPTKSRVACTEDMPTLDELLLPPRVVKQSSTWGSDVEIANRKRKNSGCLPSMGNRDEEDTENGANGVNGKTTPGKPPAVVFKENWKEKEARIRASSAFGSHPGWRLLPILVKANDDLRQEQLASQLIYRMSAILAKEQVPVWLCPYDILALTESGGIIEAIPDTISISSLKKNDPNYTSLKGFFRTFFEDPEELTSAKVNFCESLAGYSMVCFLLQMKDRHNGNILLDNKGHLIHIDFGFFFLSSPGKNTGFESAPFKLTREFVDVLDGPDSRLFRIFRMLCYRAFLALRRHCMEITLLIEMLKKGNEDLPCFRGRPDDAISELRHRFRLDLNDRACLEYVNALIDESLENWRTNWYDRYQRYCVGVL